jgi:hypothetical protein
MQPSELRLIARALTVAARSGLHSVSLRRRFWSKIWEWKVNGIIILTDPDHEKLTKIVTAFLCLHSGYELPTVATVSSDSTSAPQEVSSPSEGNSPSHRPESFEFKDEGFR